MRQPGEVTQALLSAARELRQPERAATLSELADRACIGRQTARYSVQNLRRAGHLEIVRERRVEYRNRPVAEYAPVAPASPEAEVYRGHLDLVDCMSRWGR